MNDFLCSIYLSIIWISDLVLHKTLYMSDVWKSHFLCFTAFGIIFWFSILSPTLLAFMSFARLMVVVYPFYTRYKRPGFTLMLILIVFGISLAFSGFVTLMIKFTYKYLPTMFCLPFINPTNAFLLTKIVTWFIIIIQSITPMVIILIYVVLFRTLQKSKVKGMKSPSAFQLVLQLYLITVSNILCWFPVNIVYITSMFLLTYPIELIIWTIVTILPINSIVNPLVFIFTMKKNKTY